VDMKQDCTDSGHNPLARSCEYNDEILSSITIWNI
jgi:hypothetical protein